MVDTPDPIDIHVGKALRAARLVAGATQHELAEAMGVRFQQVQKYETGFNRISASRLKHGADYLGVPVSLFFHGLDDVDGELSAVIADAEAMRLARAISGLPEMARQGIINVLAAMVPAST